MQNYASLLFAISALIPFCFVFARNVERKFIFLGLLFLFYFLDQLAIIIPVIISNDMSRTLDPYLIMLSVSNLIVVGLMYVILQNVIRYRGEVPLPRTIRNYGTTFVLSVLMLFCFLVLLINSNFTFITNPRYAYQYHRDGVGVFWVLYINLLSILFYLLMVRRRPSVLKSVVFFAAFYVTGSKMLVLTTFWMLLVAYSIHSTQVKFRVLIYTSPILIFFLLLQFDQFGSEIGFFARVANYFDFLRNAQRVFDDFALGNLDFQFGQITLSSLWSYVPRGLYPDKPYSYGSTAVLEMYYPGLASTGHTPSFGPLTTEFVDFGYFAPFAYIFLNISQILKLYGIFLVSSIRTTPGKSNSLFYLLCATPGFGFQLPLIYYLILFIFFIVLIKKKRTV